MTFSEFERVLNHCPHFTNFWLFLRVGEFWLFVLLTSGTSNCGHDAFFIEEAISKVFKNVWKTLLRSENGAFSACPPQPWRRWMVIFHALSRHSRMATPDQTTIFISSTIFFQSKFAGLLKLPLNKKRLPVSVKRKTDKRLFFYKVK